VNSSTKKSGLARAAALGLTAALIAGASLFGATAAQAAPADRYSITGSVEASGGAPLAGVDVSISFLDVGDITGSKYATKSLGDGSYSFASDQTFPDGDYTINFSRDGYGTATVDVTVAGANVTAPTASMLPVLPAGTVTITGTPVVGDVLTAVPAGWPAGTTFTYDWGYSTGQSGNPLNVTTSTYTVGDAVVGAWISVGVTGTLAGYSPTTVSTSLVTVASAPKKPTAAGPTDLAAYLAANSSTPVAQTSAGLPAGPLDPGANHTANLAWGAADSYVDVYIYSTPTLVGTFPVVNGVAQITLSKTVLATLAAGTHTLVVTGQTSGAVQSVTVALSAALASTGAGNSAPAITVASLLLLLGAALLIARRRVGHKI